MPGPPSPRWGGPGLRSSPGPEARCNSASTPRRVPPACCDPHRARRPGATRRGRRRWPVPGVAILTGPGGPVQRRSRSRSSVCPLVAILTGPGGPVQRPSIRADAARIPPVAILTGPGGPVQPYAAAGHTSARTSCDPHRARRPGATPAESIHFQLRRRCDPHRARRPGATGRCGSPHSQEVRGCDPHRARRPGATRNAARPVSRLLRWLRSSPGPEARCNHAVCRAVEVLPLVAILTGPGGPVQRRTASAPDFPNVVAILTGPGGPVQPQIHAARYALTTVAILTGPGGPVQLVRLSTMFRTTPTLRSSPGPEARCNPRPRHLRIPMTRCCDPHRARRPGATGLPRETKDTTRHVAILTGPGGPVQRRSRSGWTSRSTSCDPHRARRPGATRPPRIRHHRPAAVAILTGPGGPVQLPVPGRPGSALNEVAILTGPGGPVQLGLT